MLMLVLLLPMLLLPLPGLEGWFDGRVPVPDEGRVPVEGCVPAEGRVEAPVDGCVPLDGRVEAPVDGCVPLDGRVEAPVDGCVEGRVEAPVDGCVEGCVDEDGRLDGFCILPPFTDDLPELDPPPLEGRDMPPPPLEAPCDILCASIFMPHKMKAKQSTEMSRMKDDLNFISLLF